MHLHLNDQFQIIEWNGSSALLKENNRAPKTPFPIHLLKDRIKFILLNNISQLELSKESTININQNTLESNQLVDFDSIKIEKRGMDYMVLFSESNNFSEPKPIENEIELNKKQPQLSTNSQFDRFFSRIEQVNTELEKRNKINDELISLNKQLLLKDQLLERNKNNVDALLNNNLQAFILVDTFYSIQAFNNKAKDLFLTISKKEIEKNTFFYEYFADENLDALKNDFKLIYEEGNHQLTVTRKYFDRTHKKNRTFRVNFTGVLDKESDLRSISIGFLDITDLVDTRKELETSQNLISSVFDSTKMGILIVDNNGKFVDANKGAEVSLGIPLVELKELNIQDFFKDTTTSDSFPFFEVDKEEVLFYLDDKNNPISRTFSLRTELLKNNTNQDLLILTIQDISDEISMKERLRNITDNIPGTVFRYLLKEDGNDELLYVSNGAKELWGFDRKELIQNNEVIWNQYHPEDLEAHKNSILASKEKMSEWIHEWRYFHPKKGLRWQRGIGKPSKQTNGSTVWDSIIMDITDEKKTELDLKEKTKYLSLLSEVNQELINYEDWAATINKIFRLIGESMNVDRVYFFQYFTKNGTEMMKHEFEWCCKNTFPQINDPKLLSLPVAKTPSLTSAMKANKAFHAIIKDMADSEEKTLFLECDIKSIYSIPINVRHELFGLLGFDDCTKERKWSNQEISFLTTIAQNISIAYESHVAQKDLIKEVKARESILESIKDGFLSMDENWKITYWNEEAQNITGINKQSALGKSIWRVFPAIIDLPIKNELKKAASSKRSIQLESRFPLLEKWFELNVYPTEDGISIYFKDITDRKNKEQELILSNQRFEKVAQATNDAVWEWDLKNNSLYWGVGYEKQFGHRIENDTKNLASWKALIHPDDRNRILNSLSNAINKTRKTSWTEEFRYQNIDDTYSYVIDRGYIIRDGNSKATRIIGAMTDISHRKEYEESLEYLNKTLKNRANELTEMNLELEHFAHIASHDLQEPLRMITGFLTQLENKYADKLDDKANKYIYYAVDGAKRMRNIIIDLLDYSRAGKVKDYEYSVIDLNAVANDVKKVLNHSIQESKAEINISNLPKVKGLKLSFTQVFQNLISNAIKYRKANTSPIIDIDYTENDTHFIFSVSDNGIGIAPEYHDKIFVIFQRLHNKDEYSGTGVGLAIVKKVVEQMGGKLWIESNKKNGSTFYFSVAKGS